LIRMDFERSLEDYGDDSFIQYASNLIAEHDVVLLSDYAKGTLARVEAVIAHCNALSVPVLVDPKGDKFERYRGATLITPNLSEFEAVVGRCEQDDARISQYARELCEAYDFNAVLVTRSERGMTLQTREGAPLHLSALAREVFDVTGAGDTVISALAAGLASDASDDSLENSTRLANLAAGLVVGKVGTATVTRDELEGALSGTSLGDSAVEIDSGIVDEADLLTSVDRRRAKGERIVMTNGCFDILHPGHVTYLNDAAKLADVLIVAVNDDASVVRLKGADRPINPLHARMSVLAGLRSVTYVVPFSEDTPARLIQAISPDLLVKGGDYAVSDIAGHEHVLETGGEVIVLDFLPGYSTTSTLERINKSVDD
ncbi:MAG TPA: D-glycero-beta-D-manno-heptose 1-phosphate adenylyltransferase, partial [Halieaceae bacterium]|nr:D-glycero-beta-D-manno-heptose 1-phosphate adenylyltransferase [Halieaceae bacterium]